MPKVTTKLRSEFFEHIFGIAEGYVCIATADAPNNKATFRQSFYQWPANKKELFAFIEEVAGRRKNVWFCVNLLSKTERKKNWCISHNLVWADLDATKPDQIQPKPSLVIESSPKRYQALWRLEEEVTPEIAEDFSRRLAYKYSLSGADISGWDLTQLLRVPWTYNYKYEQEDDFVPEVKVIDATDDLIPLAEMEAIEAAPPPAHVEAADYDVPDVEELEDPKQIIRRFQLQLKETGFADVYAFEPSLDDDWSKLLWRLINICLEVGMTEVEAFTIALSSNCNKYARDGRPVSYLWRDVQKAAIQQKQVAVILDEDDPLAMPQIVDDGETTGTFIDKYRRFGEVATDAVPQFHDIAGFILLSGLLAGNLKLSTSYGTMIPNIWGLIIGESTLTRKTTAGEMAIRLLHEIDSSAILATDGTVEGLLTRLADRPGRVSLFYRDELTGFFDSINRKDYLAGMPETLTQLYDVPPVYTRTLRKETITINDPVFVFFGSGIKDRLYEILNDEYVYSGFLPRFLIISGETDMRRLRRTGPATPKSSGMRNEILKDLTAMHDLYCQEAIIKVAGQEIQRSVDTEVELTSEAWERYGNIEMTMVEAAHGSPLAGLALPTFERLSRSCLKMSMLLAASRQEPQEAKIEVTEQDVVNAAGYIQEWGQYSIDIIQNVGKGKSIRQLDKVRRLIQRTPGMHRSNILRMFHLSARETDEVLRTLVDRGEIEIKKRGKAATLWPTT